MLECDGCGSRAFTESAADPDPLLTCPEDSGCCTADHHHGRNANETGVACRPMTITGLPGFVTVAAANPGSA